MPALSHDDGVLSFNDDDLLDLCLRTCLSYISAVFICFCVLELVVHVNTLDKA